MQRALAATKLLQVHPKECRCAAGTPAIHAPLSDDIQSYPKVAGQAEHPVQCVRSLFLASFLCLNHQFCDHFL
jgi:hypothetical protein